MLVRQEIENELLAKVKPASDAELEKIEQAENFFMWRTILENSNPTPPASVKNTYWEISYRDIQMTDKPENDVMPPWSEFMSDSELEPKKSEYLFLCDEPENDVMALWSEFMDDDDDEDVLDQKIAEAYSGISEQWGASPEWINDWKNLHFINL